MPGRSQLHALRRVHGAGPAAAAGHRLRTALGALAIAAAVATIVLVVAALDGVARYARTTTARAFGSDTFLIAQVASPGRVTRRELQEQLQRNPAMRRVDVRSLERLAGGLVEYAPNAQTTRRGVGGRPHLENGAVTGTTSSLADLRDLAIVRGRFFRPDEDRARQPGGRDWGRCGRRALPGQDPLGKAVRVSGRRFEVIGLQDRLGNSGGASLDRYVWMPLAPTSARSARRAACRSSRRRPAARPSVDGRGPRADLVAGHARTAAGRARQLRRADARCRAWLRANLSERIGAAAGPISAMALLAAIVVVTNTVLVSVTHAHARDRRASRPRRDRAADHARGAGGSRCWWPSSAAPRAPLVAAGSCRCCRPTLGVPIAVRASTVALGVGGLGAERHPGGVVSRAPRHPHRRHRGAEGRLMAASTRGRAADVAASISEAARLAWDSLRAQPARSALAIGGVVIGIVTVVLVASVLVGLRNSVALLFRELGTDNIFAFHRNGDPYSPASDQDALRRPLSRPTRQRSSGSAARFATSACSCSCRPSPHAHDHRPGRRQRIGLGADRGRLVELLRRDGRGVRVPAGRSATWRTACRRPWP